MKKILLGLAFAANVIALPLAYAGSPSVVGSFRVTFYLENTRSVGATQCIVFISAPGTVAGVPTSGTWMSTTFPGWSGEWIQLGDHVRWFGNTSGGVFTTESGNMIYSQVFGGVSFNHFFNGGKTSSAGSWVGYRVPRCTQGTQKSASSDPSLTQ